MDSRTAIRTFLDTIAGRLERRAAVTVSIYVVVFIGALGLAGPLVADAAQLDRRMGMVLLGLALVALAAGGYFLVRGRRVRRHEVVARYVGGQIGPLRSDLLSAVEFMEAELPGERPDPDRGQGSPELTDALLNVIAERVEPLRSQALVPFRPLRKPTAVVAGLAGLYVLTLAGAPGRFERGWQMLLTAPPKAPFGGAALSPEPLVGDLRVVIQFPDYTARPALELPSSSGDFQAMAGSTITLETTALEEVDAAELLVSATADGSSDESVDLEVDGRLLRGKIEVAEETHFRFLLTRRGESKVEARAHRIEILPDRAPTVELYAPAPELDVAKLKRVELAYVAEDDFGISKAELVYRPADGGEESRLPLPVPRASELPPRSAQTNYLLDLAELPLRPGVKIEYHVEIFDNDTVDGPNVGRSKSYFLRVFSPRERHEDLMLRQRETFEKMVDLLGNRLTIPAEDLKGHEDLSRAAASIVVDLGSLTASLKGDELASKGLVKTIETLRQRMDARVRKETRVLAELSDKRSRSGDPSKHVADKLGRLYQEIIPELEDDVLAIADWLHREEMENLLTIADEIKDHQARLDKLFQEYKRTGSEQIKAEIERELRALERKIQDLSQKSTNVPEDVLDRFVNSDALQQEQDLDCISKVRELLRSGDPEQAQKELERCNQAMNQSAKELEQALEELREDSFSESEKRYNEIMSDLSDVADDQKEIADETEGIYERYAQAASKLLDDKSSAAKKEVSKTLDALRRRLKAIPPEGLTPFAEEEMDVLEARLDDVENMLERGDLADALSMARHSKSSLDTLQAELEATLDEAWTRETYEAERAARKTQPLARKLVEELEAATPAPSEIMSGEDRQKLDRLRRRQRSVQQRSQRLAQKAAQQADGLPGNSGPAISEALGKAMESMKEAESRMRAKDPSSARHQARQAADQLAKGQSSARGAARLQQERGQSAWREETVRIPGADEYQTPGKFREEILDAMKKQKPPAGYDELVKRYYEEIIR